MTDEQREHFRQLLLNERARLTADSDDLVVQNTNDDEEEDYGATNHPADAATDVFLRERNQALRENADELVSDIDAALGRIDAGTYGICLRTGEQIPLERLEALPYARYTIEGQRLAEQENGV